MAALFPLDAQYPNKTFFLLFQLNAFVRHLTQINCPRLASRASKMNIL